MGSFGRAVTSSVGKKVVTGLTGFFLVGFVVAHLVGNFTLLLGPSALNGYAHFLETVAHGWLIIVMEIGLVAAFVLHAWAAVSVAVADKMAARRKGYRYAANAGGASRKTFSSRTMIVSGIILAGFIVTHIVLFKYGQHEIDAHGVKNLYKTVVTWLRQPAFAAFAAVSMVLLAFHLRHGIWSAFQSMGWTSVRTLDVLTRVALVGALLLSAGYLVIVAYGLFVADPNAVGGH